MSADSVQEEQGESLTSLAETMRGSFSTVEDMTKTFIGTAIQRGIYRPGQRLQQDGIAQLLGVSRMPVRASLRQLEAEGMVTFHPHRGASVSSLTADEIREIYELRSVLESIALRGAMARMTAQDLERLERMGASIEQMEDPYGWLEARQRFHSDLYKIASSPITLDLIMRLRSYVGPYLLLKRVVEDPKGHLGLLDHVKRGDVEGAVGWLTGHLEAVSKEIQRLVRDEQLE